MPNQDPPDIPVVVPNPVTPPAPKYYPEIRFKAWYPTVANKELFDSGSIWIKDMRNKVYKNNAPVESNRKVTVKIKVLAKEWDKIEQKWFYTHGGFKLNSIKKVPDGQHYVLEFKLAPGQHFGYILPNLPEMKSGERDWPKA